MRKYIGITIGPIFDTICDASSPAALWFASSMFSDVTRRLCEKILSKEGFADAVIYSPFYSDDINMSDGVGKFHDRIFFSTCSYEKNRLDNIIEMVKKETLQIFSDDVIDDYSESFMSEYLQIHYVGREENQIGDNNCVLELSPYLDTLELMKSFSNSDLHNPIRKTFMGKRDYSNKYIAESNLLKKVDKNKNQLKKSDGSIRTIGDIALSNNTVKENLKRKRYFAVVSADGDNMSGFLKSISSDLVTEFSKVCLAYVEEAAKLIGEYGGMTIYAGGDDLLFLAPVMTDDGDICGLCNTLQNLFKTKIRENETFSNVEIIPSLSFGIAIQYIKHPLYEATEASRRLLYLAKQDGDYEKKECRKNNMAVELRKHSGQTISFVASNEANHVIDKILNLDKEYIDSEGKIVNSIIYTIHNMYHLISVLNIKAGSKEEYMKAWKNFFDNDSQKNAQGYINQIGSIYYDYFIRERVNITIPKSALFEEVSLQDFDDDSLQILIWLLRFKKFMIEREGV